MKNAVLTGGTGFLGYWLLKELVKNDVFVYVVVRPNSKRRDRLKGIPNIRIVELELEKISELPNHVESSEAFYHLAWEGERNDFHGQMMNIPLAVKAMFAAEKLGAKQFIMTGSQAEYGVYKETVTEDSPVNPSTAYGACKVACYNILRTLSTQLDLPLTWVRVFSVYGEDDNPNTLMSYLFRCFQENTIPKLTSGNQQWDFLYAEDAARALYFLGKSSSFGIYNLAYGESRPLKDFIMEARDLIKPEMELEFDKSSAEGIVELRANIEKIKNDLGWHSTVKFREGVKRIVRWRNGL